MQKSKMHVLIRYQIASSDVNNITPQTREALMAEGQFRRDDLLRQVNDDIKRSTSKLPSSRFLQINSNSIYKTVSYFLSSSHEALYITSINSFSHFQ